jgi:competence ComEA-like helix-hairpin-helix protein
MSYQLSVISKLTTALFVVALAASCSSRVVYDEPRVEASPYAININTASAADLERLPHIGRKTAEAIVQFRTDDGPFRRPEHLLLIRGVSEKRFEELRPLLRAE